MLLLAVCVPICSAYAADAEERRKDRQYKHTHRKPKDAGNKVEWDFSPLSTNTAVLSALRKGRGSTDQSLAAI